MSEVPEDLAAASATVAPPDRVTVLTCVGCGAMGREERCDSSCSEHKLVLVRAVDYDELLRAAHSARDRASRLASVVRAVAEAKGHPLDAQDAVLRLRDGARRTLRSGGYEEFGADWASPATITGWWCAGCGNVDMPQPCIGVCVWRPAQWVSLALYERQLRVADPSLCAARSLRRFLARAATVTPHAGQWQRNWEALQAQAGTALADYAPDSPAPEAPPGGGSGSPTADPVIRVHLWPR